MTLDLTEIRERLKSEPENTEALRQIGAYYLTTGRYQEAKKYFSQAWRLQPRLLANILLDYERVISKDPVKIGPRLSLAGLNLAVGEVETAKLELEEVLEIAPTDVEAYNVLGRIYLLEEHTDAVITLLEAALAKGVKDVALAEILASAYLGKGRLAEAAKFYEEILSYKPGDKSILRILGELYTRLEEYNRAAADYQAMFSDDPQVGREVIQKLENLLQKVEGSVTIREILVEIYLRSLNPEAAVAKLQEILRLDITKLEEVITRYRSILKTYPGHPTTLLALAVALRLQGNFSEAVEGYHDLAKNRPELLAEAIAGYQNVLDYCPDQALAHSYLAEAYLDQNKMTEALVEFERMLKVDAGAAELVMKKCREILKNQPQLLLAHLVLGRACLAKGDLPQAVAEAEGVIAADKKHAAAHLLLGETYFQMKLCRKAVEVLRQALMGDPYNLELQEQYQTAKIKELELDIDKNKERLAQDPWRAAQHLDLAKLYIQRGLKEEAMRELQLALKDQARAHLAAHLLGCLDRSEGRYDLAAAQFNRALELAPPESADFTRQVHFCLATAFEGQGLVRKAVKIYESILQEDIDFGDLKTRLKYLKNASLNSLRNKALIMALAAPGAREFVALWGREIKPSRTGNKEDMSVSFGEEHNTAGFDYFLKGLYKAAHEEFQLAAQLDSRFAAAVNNLGVSLLKEGRLTEALAKLASAVQINPGSVVSRNNLGLAYYLGGQIDKARAELEKAYTLDPELSAVCLNFGDVCLLRKDLKRALDLYRRAGKFDVLAELTQQRLAYRIP